MKYLKRLAIEALILGSAFGFIAGLGYLANTFGIMVALIPILLVAIYYAISYYNIMNMKD